MSLAPVLGAVAASRVIASGIQYVGGYYKDQSYVGSVDTAVSLSGALSGGIATSPAAGDLCLVFYSQSGTADRTGRTVYNAAGAFTQRMTQYVNDINDTSVTFRYKFLESPIDYTITLGDPSSSNNGVCANIQVFRGVNPATPFDVADVITPAADTSRPNPGSITPVTPGAVIGVFGAAAMGASISGAFTSSAFDAFTTLALPMSGRSHAAGFGRKLWTTGAFDAAAFGGGASTASDSCIAVAFALRPA